MIFLPTKSSVITNNMDCRNMLHILHLYNHHLTLTYWIVEERLAGCVVPLISTLLACRKWVAASNQDIDLPWGPSLNYVSISFTFSDTLYQHKYSTERRKNGHFLTSPTQSFCWRIIRMFRRARVEFMREFALTFENFLIAQTVAN